MQTNITQKQELGINGVIKL